MWYKTRILVSALLLTVATYLPTYAKPVKNIVLVHGAFVDASIWNGVAERLLDRGYTVRAVQLPLTSLKDDVSATQAVMDRLRGPILLVGYSWGGVPVTVAGTDPEVKGLVYFAAVTPKPGETLAAMLRPYAGIQMPGSSALELDEKGGMYWIDPERLHDALALDAPASVAHLMGISQKPTAARIFTDVPEKAAWQTKPSWYAVSTQDHIFPVQLQRDLVKQIGAESVEWPTGHASILSRPGDAADLIDNAAKSLCSDCDEAKK